MGACCSDRVLVRTEPDSDDEKPAPPRMPKSGVLLCSKIFLIVFNFIFLLCGLGVLGMGVWLHFDKDSFVYLQLVQGTPTGPMFDRLPYVLIGLGAFITLLCFLGCCGACAESTCFLCLYSVVLVLVLAGEITVGILAAVYYTRVKDELQSAMRIQIKQYYNRTNLPNPNNTDYLTLAWDTLQVNLKCCGSTGPWDYRDSYWVNTTGGPSAKIVPNTCCALFNDNPKYPMVKESVQCQGFANLVRAGWPPQMSDEQRTSDDLHTHGCYESVVAWVDKNKVYIILSIAVAIMFEFLLLVFSCVLIVKLRKDQDKTVWEDE